MPWKGVRETRNTYITSRKSVISADAANWVGDGGSVGVCVCVCVGGGVLSVP